MTTGNNSAKTKHVDLILEENVKYLLKLYQSYRVIGASDAIQTIQKNKMLSKERKAEDIFFMKTSRAQEKVPLEGKMHYIRKAFKNAKEDLPNQLLSPSRAVMMKSSSAASNPCSSSEQEQVEQAGPSSQSSFVNFVVSLHEYTGLLKKQ